VIYKALARAWAWTHLWANRVVRSPIFENFILLVIVSNSILLATQDPKQESDQFVTVEVAFDCVYIAELALKIVARGVVFPMGAFFREFTNLFDFVVVGITVATRIADTDTVKLNSLRVFRVLIPLRTLLRFKELKVILGTLFAMKSLILDAIFVIILSNVFFAIIGLELNVGALKKTCVTIEDGRLGALCSGKDDCLPGQVCGKRIANPVEYLNWDTFGWAFIMVFFQGSS
jgi:hypothetical protein